MASFPYAPIKTQHYIYARYQMYNIELHDDMWPQSKEKNLWLRQAHTLAT